MSLGEVRKQSQAVCESMQDFVQIPKDLLRQAHIIQAWSGSKRNDRKAELE